MVISTDLLPDQVMDLDYGIVCSSDEYWRGAIAAAAALIIFTVLVPVFLVVKARAAIRRRDASFELRVTDVEKWFDQADADGSGAHSPGRHAC